MTIALLLPLIGDVACMHL